MRSQRRRLSEMQDDRDIMKFEGEDLKNEGFREHWEEGHGQGGLRIR